MLVKILVCDVDGVLTDGKIYMSSDGWEMKIFHAHDGIGMRLAQKHGLPVFLVTGRKSEVVKIRAQELGIPLEQVHEGIRDKLLHMQGIWEGAGVTAKETAFIGDDLNDLSLLRHVGLACSVPNGVPEVKKAAHYITEKPGGEGAVREVVELILKNQGKWNY